MDYKSAKTSLVARVAGRQHGVISARQLADAGVARDVAAVWARKGRLHRLHRGVYAVGHAAVSAEGRWMAAVLACGEGAVLSHRSAAYLWGLLDPRLEPVHISVSTIAGRKKRTGIRVHRRSALGPDCVTRRRNIPVTTPGQTIADLRGTVSPAQHRRAVRQAEVLGLRTGLAPRAPTRSELEDRFLALCRRYGIPAPEVDVRIGPHLVDFLWPAAHLVIETDGYRYHRGAAAFEQDHVRDLDLRDRGFDVLRLTYRQVTDEPTRTATAVRNALQP